MAAADTATMNGYDAQYSAPAELAASTPSHQASASQSSTATTQKPDPQEIGWYFVEQYYTTLSKNPDKVHLFYNKKSQLITGREAEKILPAVGSKVINEKIKSLDFHDCKVRVLNVDCQSSFENIVVQVIGELSNRGQPHERFVQTFVLATQPNGYFVLNDIFRYLNDEDPEIVDDEEPAQEETLVEEPTAAATDDVPAAAPEPELVNNEAAVEQVDEALEAVKDEPSSAEPEVNGVEQPEPATESTADVIEEATPAVEEVKAAPVEEKPIDPEPSPVQTPSAPTPAPAPASSAPAAKKTWASLVGSNKTTAAAPVSPVIPQANTTTSTSAKTPRPAPAKTTTSAVASEPNTDTASTASPASQADGWQMAETGKKGKAQQSKAQDAIVHAYIKNVNEKIDARELREKLESFGSLKYFDVSRPKQCAFVEFDSSSSYTAAVAANPHTVSGETVNVEERRPRPGQSGQYPTQNGRGGAFAGRGSRGGAPRGGRGDFQARGGKPSGATRGKSSALAA